MSLDILKVISVLISFIAMFRSSLRSLWPIIVSLVVVRTVFVRSIYGVLRN